MQTHFLNFSKTLHKTATYAVNYIGLIIFVNRYGVPAATKLDFTSVLLCRTSVTKTTYLYEHCSSNECCSI